MTTYLGPFEKSFEKHYRNAVNRNQTANSELKRAALTSSEIKTKIKMDLQKEIHSLKTKHKMAAEDQDVEFMITAYVELYLGLASIYHNQTASQKLQAKQEGGLKVQERDGLGLDREGNGTVEIDGQEVMTIADKKEAGPGPTH